MRHDDRWTGEAIASVIGMVLFALVVVGCIAHGVRHDGRIQHCQELRTEAQQIECMGDL